MSPQSQRKKRAVKGEGRIAPLSLRSRMDRLEEYIRSASADRGPQPPSEHVTVAFAGTKLTNMPSKPPIKGRLEALLDAARGINNRLDSLSNTVLGDGTPTEAGQAPAPYAIPDQLDVLEALLHNANQTIMKLSDRF